METAKLQQDSILKLTELWVGDAAPTEADLRAARSLAARLGIFQGLKPFPTVVQRLVEHVSTPNFELDQVRELIESDPALAARIMRVANSAAYRAYEACTSISRAVLRIGSKGVVELAMGMSAMGMFEDLGGKGRKIRDHSAGTAAVVRELAFRLDRSVSSSKLFLVGLLHDIGKLLMIQSADPVYADLVGHEPSPNTWHVEELERFGFDHGQLGGQVLRAWKLPEPIPEIIAAHHLPKVRQGRTMDISRAVDLLRVADGIDWLIDQGANADSSQTQRLVNSPDGVRAGLTQSGLEELWEDLVQVRQEAIAVFQK